MKNEQKQLFLAIGLSAAVLFIFQTYFAPKTPVGSAPVRQFSEKAVVTGTSDVSPIAQAAATGSAPIEPIKLINHLISNNDGAVTITSNLGITDFQNIDSKYDFKKIVGENVASPFILQIKVGNVFKSVSLNLKNESGQITGTNSEYGINFIGSIDSERRFHYGLTSSSPQIYRLIFKSTEKQLDNSQVRSFIFLGGNSVEHFEVGDEDEFDGTLKWVGLDFNFHIFTMVFKKNRIARINNENGILIVDLVEPTQSFNSYFIFVKKDYDLLNKIGDKLHLSVDFGIFGIISVPILRGIQFAYKYIPNYGIAIILLTILLRIITFPLYYKSIISMKKMQTVQPELKKLKEKFKDDPQRMQKETMALFKKAGANPLGGCFPMLLQMPIFFAFYQVLYNAVELVNAPFFGWITDLSVKDPFFVLPVLMAASMFVQQKLTPTTSVDPMQQKLMMFMPIIFGFIMKDLPAGLVLYIFVSTLFGILQQLFVYKVTD